LFLPEEKEPGLAFLIRLIFGTFFFFDSVMLYLILEEVL